VQEEVAGVCTCRGVAIDGKVASEVGKLAVKLNVLADPLGASDGWLVLAHWFAQARGSEIELGACARGFATATRSLNG
jgi:hypothetical protein